MENKSLASEKQLDLLDKLKIKYPRDCTKEEASGLIKEHLESKYKPGETASQGTYSPSSKGNSGVKSVTMYASYSKDIFLGFLAKVSPEEFKKMKYEELTQIMESSTDLVNQARLAFEDD